MFYIVRDATMLKPALSCTQVKQMAAVLLRRLLSSSFEEIYPGLPVTLQVAIRQSFSPVSNRRARPTSARRSATLRPSSPATSSVTAPRRVTFKSWLLWRWALIWFLWSCDLDDDGNNQWPELLKFLFDSVNSDNVGLREAALHIFWWVTLYMFQILHWSVSTKSLASVHWLDSSVPSWKASFEDTVSIKHK